MAILRVGRSNNLGIWGDTVQIIAEDVAVFKFTGNKFHDRDQEGRPLWRERTILYFSRILYPQSGYLLSNERLTHATIRSPEQMQARRMNKSCTAIKLMNLKVCCNS
jgi:hypothetical protein